MHSTPPAAKRLKHDVSLSSHRRVGAPPIVGGGVSGGGGAPAPFPGIYQDEDTSLGDNLDMLTAREISISRFVRHHEWMEEALGTPAALYSRDDRIRESNHGISSKQDGDNNNKMLEYKEAIDLYDSFLSPTHENNEGGSRTYETLYQNIVSDVESRLANVQQEVDHLSSRDTHDEIFSLRSGAKSLVVKQAIQKCRSQQHKLMGLNSQLPHHAQPQSHHHHQYHSPTPAAAAAAATTPLESTGASNAINIKIVTPTDQSQREIDTLQNNVQEALHMKIVPRNKVTPVPINFSTD